MKTLTVIVGITMTSGVIGVLPVPAPTQRPAPTSEQRTDRRVDVRDLLASARGVAPGGAAAGRGYPCAGPALSRSLRHPLLSPIPCLATDPNPGSDMQSWLPTAVGVIAGCCSTAAFVPQVLKIWREGDTRAISTRMYVLRDLGFVLWLAYGLALRSTPLIVFNVASLLLGGTILVLKLRGKARETRVAAPDHELGSAAWERACSSC